ncbi:hypothetical protein RRG08_005973 [Elysia crispata]|uniref:Uncharacterized protein n=1 Tax=Elysia crispata TaxID=231223 RepID=A0AAE0YPT2_9GAST|nr:hypothetical protein RRG08_005973 [Elysia crispata]
MVQGHEDPYRAYNSQSRSSAFHNEEESMEWVGRCLCVRGTCDVVGVLTGSSEGLVVWSYSKFHNRMELWVFKGLSVYNKGISVSHGG